MLRLELMQCIHVDLMQCIAPTQQSSNFTKSLSKVHHCLFVSKEILLQSPLQALREQNTDELCSLELMVCFHVDYWTHIAEF